MQYNFDEFIDRAGTNATKYAAARRVNPHLPEEFIPMWIADMEFACASPILEAMRARLDRRILGYSSVETPAYFDAVTGWMRRRFGWEIEPEWITFSCGVVASFYAAVQILTKPNDRVLLMTPAYHPFDDAIVALGRAPLYSPLIERDGYYTVDWDDFAAKAADPRCTLFFLCSPHNPTGRVWTTEELTRIGEICFANNVFVVDDEIHADLLRAGVRHTPLAKLFPAESRIVTCTSPSKTFNIAGNRHANLIIPDESVRATFADNAYCGHLGAFGIDATIAAYNECEDWLMQLNAYLDESFAVMDAFFKRRLPKARFRIPEGTYLGWVDLSELGLSEDALDRLVSGAGVFVQFGKDFVSNADCHARINIACPRKTLLAALERICDALAPCGG